MAISGSLSAIVLGVATFGSPAWAYACTSLADVAIDPSSAVAGEQVTVQGTTFDSAANASAVEVRLDGQRGQLLWSGRPDSSGRFSFSFVTPQVASGNHYVAAYQTQANGAPVPGSPARGAFEVTTPPPASQTTPVQPAGDSVPQGAPAQRAPVPAHKAPQSIRVPEAAPTGSAPAAPVPVQVVAPPVAIAAHGPAPTAWRLSGLFETFGSNQTIPPLGLPGGHGIQGAAAPVPSATRSAPWVQSGVAVIAAVLLAALVRLHIHRRRRRSEDVRTPPDLLSWAESILDDLARHDEMARTEVVDGEAVVPCGTVGG